MSAINESLTCFALDMLKKVSESEKDAIFSPTSINLALAMCYAGAEGSTKSQMKQRFYGNQVSDADVHDSMQKLLDWFDKSSDEDVQLAVANRMCCQKDFEILQTFRDVTEKRYKSTTVSADFKNAGNREKARLEINNWVSEITRKKINDLIGASDVNEDTRMILVNALYFKGLWANQFAKNATTKKTFYINPTKSAQVDMMHKSDDFHYFENAKCQVVCIPYVNRQLKMAVLLPKDKFGLAELEKSITSGEFLSHMKSMRNISVKLEIPKMKLEQSFELSDALIGLGVKDAFDDSSADFSPITGKRNLKISKVLHKAFIEVDEKGTEAAAATTVIMSVCCSMPIGPPPTPKIFVADHPFLFAILSNENNDVLFLGHYYAGNATE